MFSIQIPPPESKQPEGGDASSDNLTGGTGETKAGAISGGIIGVLALLIAVIFFLKYKKKKGGSSKKAADYTYSPAGGGDELDNLIPNKQSFVFRNHYNHTRFKFLFHLKHYCLLSYNQMPVKNALLSNAIEIGNSGSENVSEWHLTVS